MSWSNNHMQNLDLLLDGLQGKKKEKKEKKRKKRKKKRQRNTLKAELACISQWSWQPDKATAMPLPNVKYDLQRPKHTAQRQRPGQCLHSLWAEAFHGQASASQENTPQCSVAASNLWFSSSQNVSPASSSSYCSQGFPAAFPLLSQCQSLKHFSFPFFLSFPLCPHFVLFPDFSIARQIPSYQHTFTYKMFRLLHKRVSITHDL